MNNSSSLWFKPHFSLKNESSDSKDENTVQVSKIKRTNNIKKNTPAIATNVNLIDRIAPNNKADLAVHGKKVSQVEEWLRSNVINSDKVSILLLTGPTGSGKTETLKVLCKFLNVEISEWINPADNDNEEIKCTGQTVKFTDFLIESSRYRSLFNLPSKKIILVEEYPNSIICNPSDLEMVLLKVVEKGKYPLVFISTDTKDKHLNLSQKLFSQTLCNAINIDQISFNPIGASLLKTALKRWNTIVQEKYNANYQCPSQATVDSIVNSCNGDIRCALNSFSFACLKGSRDLETTVREKSVRSSGLKRKRKGNDREILSNMCKDEAVGLLHGIGRILYPKKIQNGAEWKFEHAPESLFNEFITQPKTVVNFLQENYIRYFANFSDICKGAEILSFSDLLLNDWKDDDLIAHYGLWYSISGLMIVNEKSVSKWNPVRGPKYISNKNDDKFDFEDAHKKTMEKTYLDIINKTVNSRFSLSC